MLRQAASTAATAPRKRTNKSSRAAPGPVSEPLVDAYAAALSLLGAEVSTGVFGAHMQVALVNDGPVTIWIDSDDLKQPRRGANG